MIGKPIIKKLGTIDCDMVETTPVIFGDKLYRFEYVRTDYKSNKTGASYFRFIDLESGRPTPAFAAGYHFGSACVKDDTAYVYGVDDVGSPRMRAFWSRDLTNWSSLEALYMPTWRIFNNSVCKGDGRYVMAIELGEPPEEVGVPFTMRFAVSDDLIHWSLAPSGCVYSKDRYTACPAIRFHDGKYYMIYLEAKSGPTYEPYIVQTEDLIHWENSPYNPIMCHSPEDKVIANQNLSAEQRERIARAVDINNSDVDLCEFKGKTVIYYSWGNQQGNEFLAEAVYDGELRDFLLGFFPDII